MEKAGQESHHPGLRQERHGLGEEPEESSLQQDLQENYVQPLGSVQIKSRASYFLFLSNS